MNKLFGLALISFATGSMAAETMVHLTKGFDSTLVRGRIGELVQLHRESGAIKVFRCHFKNLTVNRYTDRPEWLGPNQKSEPVPCLRCDEALVWKQDRATLLSTEPGMFFYKIGASHADYCGEEPPTANSCDWLRVAIRGGEDYLGILKELFQTPFLVSPKKTQAGYQTDLGWGSDCAAFAIYGRRRLGEAVGYRGPRGIIESLRPICGWLRLKNGRYCDENGFPTDLEKVGLKPGQIVHSGEQVSVFYSDGGIAGYLDPEDLVIQAQPGGASIVALRDNGYFPKPIRVFRWINK